MMQRMRLLQSNPASGIKSNTYVVLVGLAAASWPLMGYDAAAHLIEETKSADTVAGRPMPWTVALSVISGLIYILALGLCIQVSFLPQLCCSGSTPGVSGNEANVMPSSLTFVVLTGLIVLRTSPMPLCHD